MALTRPPVTPPDGTFSDAGRAAWNAGFGIAGATAGGLLYTPTATTEAVTFVGTFANFPAASSNNGVLAFATDVGASGVYFISDGTRWKVLGGTATLASLGAASGNIANSETICFQTLIPAGVWQTNDRLIFRYSLSKSGTTDIGTSRIRIGTAGTTSDAQVMTGTTLIASNISVGVWWEVKLASATTAQVEGGQGTAAGTYNASGTAYAAAVTISSAASNALYASISVLSGGTNDTLIFRDGLIQLITP